MPFDDIIEEYCKDTTCASCGGTGHYFCNEDGHQPCTVTIDKSNGRKVREETMSYPLACGEGIVTRWLYVDDGTQVPNSTVER
jgi:hypothetical protein